MTTSEQLDQLVNGYLARVERAAHGLPVARRAELLADLGEHIAAARAELDTQTEAGVRAILDRLGDPQTLAAEAGLDEAQPPSPPALAPSAKRRMGPVGCILIALVAMFVVCVAYLAFGLAVRQTFNEPGVEFGPPEPVGVSRQP